MWLILLFLKCLTPCTTLCFMDFSYPFYFLRIFFFLTKDILNQSTMGNVFLEIK